MAKTKYSPFDEITILQRKIMIFIDRWVREKNTPIPLKEILKELTKEKIPAITITGSVESLRHKGYIRRAYVESGGNRTFYVQLRSIHLD